jgi:uroporphyrinogen decarboxylase
VIAPNARIVEQLKARYPDVPVIVFPRGAGISYRALSAAIAAAGIGLDTSVPADWAAANLQPRHALQGNLDPLALVAGGAALTDEVGRIRRSLGKGPFIFNLGHGVLPETPPEHVAELVRLVRT